MMSNEKKKYTIRIQRTEYYEVVVDIEAESAAAAIREVEEREANNEFANQFDAPYDVETHVHCPAEDTEA